MNILEMLTWPFMQRALIAGVLVSLCAALLGVSLVLKRYSMIGDGLSHVSFGALAIAVALGVTPLYFSIPVVILAAFFLLRMASHPRWNSDAAVAVMSASALAVGVIVISRTTGMTTDVDNYMFGSVLAMTDLDVLLAAGLSLAVLVLFVLFYHKLFAVTFDESFSRATGLKVDRYNTLLAVLTALTIVLDDGRHADLLPGDLPGPDGHAAVQEFPGRHDLRRDHGGGVLLRGAHRLLGLVHAGGRVRGGGQPHGVPALLRRRLCAQPLRAAEGAKPAVLSSVPASIPAPRRTEPAFRPAAGFFARFFPVNAEEYERKVLRFDASCAMMHMLEV